MPEDQLSNRLIEFLPPEPQDKSAGSMICLCCEQRRPASCMDEDGCGICEECLSA